MACLQVSSCRFYCCNKLSYVVLQSFFASSCFPRFSWVKFLRVQVFQGPDFSGSGSRVKVQSLSPGFRSSRCQSNFIEITLLHGCSHVNLLHVFRTVSHKITSRGLLLNIVTNKRGKGDRKLQCNRNYDFIIWNIYHFSVLLLLLNTNI